MRIWLSIAALGLVLTGAATAEPMVKRNIVHYDVGGATAQDIRAELNRLGPIDATRWHIKWTYRYRNVGQDCAIARVAVTVDVTITVPRLKSGSPVELNRAFEEFAQKLMAHEEDHAQNGIDAGKRIEAAIQDIRPYPTCDALGRTANALGESLIKEANQKDVEYDARTQHGRSQGARFP